jgi:hypothetical protein
MQDKVEFSWGSSAVAGIPQHCYFFANHGYARVDPQVVAKHLSFVLGSAIEHLRSELPDETAFTSLRADFQNLLDVDRTKFIDEAARDELKQQAIGNTNAKV